MNQTVYIKAPQCIDIKNPDVHIKDFLTVYSSDNKLTNQIQNILFYQFNKEKKEQIVVSVLKIIELLTELFPNLEIENLGEGDFILNYEPEYPLKKVKQILFAIFISLTAFFGGGYAIMAYNTDIGAKELFTYLSMLFLGDAKTGVMCLTITYAIGLTLGMLLFFNHLGSKKLTSDPTPLEIQMRLYEKDISTTVIKDVSRRSENIDVN